MVDFSQQSGKVNFVFRIVPQNLTAVVLDGGRVGRKLFQGCRRDGRGRRKTRRD